MGKARCLLCGASFFRGDVFLSNGTRAVCLPCADGAGAEELTCLAGAGDTRGVLFELGFQKDFI